MTRRLLLLLCIFFLAIPMLAEGRKGNIDFAATVYDFGTFPKTTVRRVIFVFVNKGKAPVVIQSTQTTCACTSAVHSTRVVSPGKKGYITVFYDGNRTHDKGIFKKTVDVYSNAENSVVRLTIKGETK